MAKVSRRAAVICQRSNTKPAGVGLVSTKAESAAAYEPRRSRVGAAAHRERTLLAVAADSRVE